MWIIMKEMIIVNKIMMIINMKWIIVMKIMW